MTTLFTIIGFIGAGAFALCTAPQIIRVLKRKSTADISLLFILLSLLGNLASASYIFYTNITQEFYQWPQYFNYSIATTLVVTLLVLKLKYDGKQIMESFQMWWSDTKYRIWYFCHFKANQWQYYMVVALCGATFGFLVTQLLFTLK